MTVVRRAQARALRSARDAFFTLRLPQIEKAIVAGRAQNRTPQQIFGTSGDALWFWLHTAGYRKSAVIRALLPGAPAPDVQTRFTGAAGDQTLREGFAAYRLFKRQFERHRGRLAPGSTVLDFGCGWGRIIRFFLRDVAPGDAWGIDCFDLAIEICRATNRWSRFELTGVLPPTDLPAASFDLIYCYSVFSHLSEDAHLRWLAEFERLLKPGGVFIATTRPREFILRCAELRRQPNLSAHLVGAAQSFPNTQQSLRDYDRGEFCHSPSGGGDVLDSSFYGETCIPKGYVEREWSKYFAVLDFLDRHGLFPQNAIVVRKQ